MRRVVPLPKEEEDYAQSVPLPKARREDYAQSVPLPKARREAYTPGYTPKGGIYTRLPT